MGMFICSCDWWTFLHEQLHSILNKESEFHILKKEKAWKCSLCIWNGRYWIAPWCWNLCYAICNHKYLIYQYGIQQWFTIFTISPKNNSSVSKLTLPSSNSRNDDVWSLQTLIHENIKYSYLFKSKEIAVCRECDVMNKQVKWSDHKAWYSVILQYFLKDKAMKYFCIRNGYNYYFFHWRNNKA